MSIGLAFIRSAVASKRDITFLVDYGLEVNDFVGEEKKVIRFVSRYSQRYEKLPKYSTLAAHFDDIDFPERDNLDYLSDQIKIRSISTKAKDKIQAAFECLRNNDIDEAHDLFESISSDFTKQDQGNRVFLYSAIQEEILKYHDDRQQQNFSPQIVPFGFPSLDGVSEGTQSGETVAIVGDTGVGKTFTLCTMSNAAYNAGNNVLIVSMEMSAEQIARRILAIRSKLGC